MVRLGQPVVVENVTGAGGTIGLARSAVCRADGYTINLGQWGTNMANGPIYPLQYGVIGDFEPVAVSPISRFCIDSRKTLPAKDQEELIGWLKASTDKATEGNSGIGDAEPNPGISAGRTRWGSRWQMVPIQRRPVDAGPGRRFTSGPIRRPFRSRR